LALSFVREAKDIRELKAKMTKLRARPKGLEVTGGDLGFSTTYEDDAYIPIISKIEKPQAIDNLEEILEYYLKPLKIPVLYGLPLGHTKDMATLPLGVKARLDADKKQFTILESGVV